MTALNTLELHLLNPEEGCEWRKPNRSEYITTILFQWNEKEGEVRMNVPKYHSLSNIACTFKISQNENMHEELPGLYAALVLAYVQAPELVKNWIITLMLEDKGLDRPEMNVPKNTRYAKEAITINYPNDIVRAIKISKILMEQKFYDPKEAKVRFQYLATAIKNPEQLTKATGGLETTMEFEKQSIQASVLRNKMKREPQTKIVTSTLELLERVDTKGRLNLEEKQETTSTKLQITEEFTKKEQVDSQEKSQEVFLRMDAPKFKEMI